MCFTSKCALENARIDSSHSGLSSCKHQVFAKRDTRETNTHTTKEKKRKRSGEKYLKGSYFLVYILSILNKKNVFLYTVIHFYKIAYMHIGMRHSLQNTEELITITAELWLISD